MATNRRARQQDEPDTETVLPRVTPAEESYSAFMAKWGRDGAKVRVYRVTPQGKQYCFLAQPEEVDPEYIRMFHAKQNFAHESGQYLIEVELDGEVRPPFPILIAPQTAAPGIPETSNNGGGGNAELMRMLIAQNERLEQRLSQQAREPIGDLADALLKVDQLRGGGNKELPIDALMKAIQLGKEIGGGGAGDSWISLVREVAPALAPALGAIATSLTARNQSQPPQQQEAPVNAEVMLKMGIEHLKKKALGGSDPDLYVDIVIDNRAEPLYGELIRRIVETDFSAFAAIDPDIDKPQFQPFFRAFYDGLRSAFIPNNPVGPDTNGKTGNGTDSPGNAKPSKPRKS